MVLEDTTNVRKKSKYKSDWILMVSVISQQLFNVIETWAIYFVHFRHPDRSGVC